MTKAKKHMIPKTQHSVNKNFFYEQNDVTLNFSLRIDVKTQLKDFKKLLELALKDVEQEIKK